MPTHPRLSPAPLTAAAFAPFGDVIQIDSAKHFPMNGGALERYYDLANIDVGADSEGRPVISIANTLEPRQLPYDIEFLERHPHGSQAIFPLFAQTMIIVVAPPCEAIESDQLRAFYSNGRQGINFHKGVWHLPILPLTQGQSFMLIDRGGPNPNCDEFHFETPIHLMPPAKEQAQD